MYSVLAALPCVSAHLVPAGQCDVLESTQQLRSPLRFKARTVNPKLRRQRGHTTDNVLFTHSTASPDDAMAGPAEPTTGGTGCHRLLPRVVAVGAP